MENNKPTLFNTVTQIAIPLLTIGTQIFIALKLPQWGLVVNFLAQPFWLYSGWKSYRKAGQSGIFITSVIVTIVIGLGILNYWVKF